MPRSREQRIVAAVEDDTAQDLALGEGTLLGLNERGGSGGHIKNIDVLQLVCEAHVHGGSNRLAHLDCEPVIALVVFHAQIIRL